MRLFIETLRRAADDLSAGRGLAYRERLQLERAVFRIMAGHSMGAFGWSLQSMSGDAQNEFFSFCRASNISTSDPRLIIINRGFEAMRLIASIANVDPYVLNENISRIVHRYSTGVATLPLVLYELAAAHSQLESDWE